MILVLAVALLWLAAVLVVSLATAPTERPVEVLVEHDEPVVRPLVLHHGGRSRDAA